MGTESHPYLASRIYQAALQTFILTDLFVLSVLLFSVLAWLAVFHWQTRRALRWWFEQQQQWLYREAEQVRNGPLQETFVMQRQLELNPEAEPVPQANGHATWMAQVTALNGQLVRLSDDLSPPYLETSLPLAIQSWAQQHQWVILAPNLPEPWHSEPPARVHLLLSMLDYLQQLSSQAALPESGAIAPPALSLSQSGTAAELVVKMTCPTAAAAANIARSPEVHHLMRAFRVLAPGRCRQQQQQQTIAWRFGWRLAERDELHKIP